MALFFLTVVNLFKTFRIKHFSAIGILRIFDKSFST